MFQLKARVERLRIAQPHDPLWLGSTPRDQGRLIVSDELMVTTADLCPHIVEHPDKDETVDLKGYGEGDDQVLVDSNGELCDGKPETVHSVLILVVDARTTRSCV
jgi:hypothetical protein